MNVTVVDKASLVERLERPCNPPEITESFTGEDFLKEWCYARDALKDLLDAFGVWNAYGEGDYFLDDFTDMSRGIGVEVTNAKILNESLVGAVQKLLRTFDKEFEVHFLVAIKGLLFDLFVSRNEVITDHPKLIGAG